MPNGGITPDCVHCKWYSGKPINDKEPYCTHHKMSLPIPIRAFCSNWKSSHTGDTNWLDEMLNRDNLQDEQMYVWLGGYEVEFHYATLASIVEYGQWTREKFYEEVSRLTSESD